MEQRKITKRTSNRTPPADARSFSIIVTEADIERAHRNDSYHCVVAQAIARKIPDATRVEVDTQSIRFTRPGLGRVTFFTPYSVQGYVVAFDAGDEIGPFRFLLKNPVRIQQRKATEAGKVAMKARAEAQKQIKQAPAKAAPAKATNRKVEAKLPVITPKDAYAKARQENPGPKTMKVEGEVDRSRTAPRVFKAKHRTYGSRLLRVNQKTT